MDSNRHFYLYAKGWYQETKDVEDDLKVILGRYCGMPSDGITTMDIAHKLLGLVEPHIDNKYNFKQFALRIFLTQGSVDALIRECMTVLALVRNTDLGFALGDPDPTLLPLKHRDTL